MVRLFIVVAALSGLVSVGLGAYASHGLKQVLSPVALQSFQTGVQYQMYHALALLGVAILLQLRPQWPCLKASALAFILGAVMFSGSIYWLTLGGPRWLWPVTPIGGFAFVIGWLLLAIAAWRGKA